MKQFAAEEDSDTRRGAPKTNSGSPAGACPLSRRNPRTQKHRLVFRRVSRRNLSRSHSAQEFGAQRDDQEEVHKTDALLASAQVAIYPIAAEGVGLDSSSSAATDPRLTQPQLVPQATPQQISNPRNQDTQLRNANRAAMDLIAKDTGRRGLLRHQ